MSLDWIQPNKQCVAVGPIVDPRGAAPEPPPEPPPVEPEPEPEPEEPEVEPV